MAATINLTIVPAVVTLVNNSGRVKSVQFYKTNLTQAIPNGDTLTVIASTSAELFYWLAKADSGLTVSAVAKA